MLTGVGRTPTNVKCSGCNKKPQKGGKLVKCSNFCEAPWYHVECADIQAESEADWVCPQCRINDVEKDKAKSSQHVSNDKAEKVVPQPTLEQLANAVSKQKKIIEQQQKEFAARDKAAVEREKAAIEREKAAIERERLAHEKRAEELAELRQQVAELSRPKPTGDGAKRKTSTSVHEPEAAEANGDIEEEIRNLKALAPNDDEVKDYDPNGNTSRKLSLGAPFYDPTWNDSHRTERDLAVSQLTATMKRQHIAKLPPFNGSVKDWAFFEAVFNSTTVEGQFTEAENVVRLRECLKKPALDLVLDQVMFSTNASQIMSDLKGAYGRADRLIIILTDEILSLPSLKRQSDPKLREFGIAMKNFVANMKALNRSCDLTNEFTLSKVAEKLQEAPGLYKEWARRKINNPAENLESFAKFLMEKVNEMPPGLLPTAEARPLNPQKKDQHSNRLNTHRTRQDDDRLESEGTASKEQEARSLGVSSPSREAES